MTGLSDIFDKKIYDTIAKVPNNFAHYEETLVNWCNINTGSRNYLGIKSFLPLLEDAFSVLPGTINRKELNPEKVVLSNGMIEEVDLGHSFHLKVRPDAPIQIVLTGHYDTVFPIDSPFQKVAPSDTDELNGPGVADMKGGILVMLEGLKGFEHYEFKDNIGYEVLLSPDEEIGSLGSAHLLHEIGSRSDLGLTYEPALPDGSMAGARKGSANFALIIHGKSAHVGRAHSEGISAILAAAKFVTALEGNNDNLHGVTFNCGKIDGGSANNVVPDMAIVRFNIRAPSPLTMDWAVDVVKENIAAITSNGIHCHLEGGISRPPKPKNKAQEQIMSDISRIAEGLGITMQFKDTGGVCEGNNLFASGCPNIDTLGVLGGNIHSPNEYVLKSSFGKRAALTTAILCAYASGKLDAKALRKLM